MAEKTNHDETILEQNRFFGIALFFLIDKIKHEYQELTIIDAKNVIKKLVNGMQQADDNWVIIAQGLMNYDLKVQLDTLTNKQQLNFNRRIEDIRDNITHAISEKIITTEQTEFYNLIDEKGLFGLINIS